MGSVMTHRAGLLCGFFRAGNDVLFFDRLNPKTRRQIRQVGDNGNERPARINMRPTLANLTIKMRDHGNKKVRRILMPVVSPAVCGRAEWCLREAEEDTCCRGSTRFAKECCIAAGCGCRSASGARRGGR